VCVWCGVVCVCVFVCVCVRVCVYIYIYMSVHVWGVCVGRKCGGWNMCNHMVLVNCGIELKSVNT